ncbi:hypothetical protein FOA52_007282 [Chlamydomonas sp. UWO 241]|nr:hypothetical protein FOA52_007282 [Chlamydomonas sp. UWO 241]
MGHAPSAYDEAYGNPCWQAAGGAGLRCLPAFFISGSFNGGGSLGRFVAAHPDVAFDAGTLSSWGRSWSYWSEYRNQMGAYLSGISSAAGTALTADPVRTRVMDGGHNTMSLYWAASGKAHRAFAGVAVACWARWGQSMNQV